MDLAIDESEEVGRNVVEFLVNRSDDGSDGSFDGLNSGSQRTGILLGIFIERREAYHHVRRRYQHQIQIFQLLLLTFQYLQIQYKQILDPSPKIERDNCKKKENIISRYHISHTQTHPGDRLITG